MEFLSAETVAKLLNISSRTARKLGESHVLPGAIKVGKQWRFRKDLLLEWLEKETQPVVDGNVSVEQGINQ